MCDLLHATSCLPSVYHELQIWDRRKHISSGTDPLDHIFTEFDEDHDGYLDAEDVCSALRSRNVNITHEQAQMFLEGNFWPQHAQCVESALYCMHPLS